MAQTNVSSCVLSIVASFSSGLDVFKQFREKRKRKQRSKSNDSLNAGELRLARSLRQGQEDIGREYLQNVQIAGDQFAVGDVIAQTSLAEVLLKLNTGLVNIISTFLGREKGGVKLNYESLTGLSDSSRLDTCCALRQLFLRMTQLRTAQVAKSSLALQPRELSDPNDESKRRRKHRRIQGPVLARVVIADSSKPSQIAMVKPGERKRKPASSEASHNNSKAPSAEQTTASVGRLTGRCCDNSLVITNPYQQPHHVLKASPQEITKSADVAKASKVQLHSSSPDGCAPPVAYRIKPPLETSDHRRRKATPTYYSIASDGTKLGEIPLHKWQVPFDFDEMSITNKQAELDSYPGCRPGHVDGKKRRFGFLRLRFFRGDTTS
ncbi:hypothetical protein LTR56_024763 [Elasticomyces elasticus]|nr:hypothetical protein LTR56_024763 [Elasticomyces elasticus]KAK3635071.1 hypothetical protein LTR22_019351 [Elasticomyces elasticus]KAK4900448.1 hypothetical protein LTR49_027460 [Elasticomyces elasticus]KAK5759407.1 hypothetical protein LTS12_010420 [Elasticomyces elasticus]